ncbi:MAG TPA: D-alanyl-D-alanine carboxypeptidase family protein, partial [Pseudogracilibacillus sp.]|nr:D-alanyl-D-alanine carboxypeptidase family protein [Pseudogracilibacillus sp.]
MINKFRNKWIIGVVLLFACLVVVQPSMAEAKEIKTKAKTAILVDGNTGKVLYAKDADEALPPASMTKMMTEYLVLEKIKDGEIDWEDTTEISDYPYWISGNDDFSGVGLVQNKEYTVKSLYEAMAIYSDNGTSVALAELIAGSEGDFVKLMNEKAEEFGMTNSKFVNATGLDNETLDGRHPEGTKKDESNLMSARDAAILAYHIVNDHPEALEISSIAETDFDGQKIRNYNWMLKHDASFLKPFYYEGMDGLKTGNTELAGYTFTGTAERDDKRLIAVIMKTKNEEERFNETAKILDHGFDSFEETELFPAGYQLEGESTIPVDKGKESHVEVETKGALSFPIEKDTEENYEVAYHLDKELLNDDGALKAPIKKGDVIGEAEIVVDEENDFGYLLEDGEKVTTELIATEDVDKKNWF